MQKLQVRECLRFGWETFKSRPGVFVLAVLIIFGASLALNFVAGMLESAIEMATGPEYFLAAIVGFVLSFAIGTLIEMGMNRFYLKAHDDVASVSLHDLKKFHPFRKYFLARLLAGVAVLAGFLLLIIPGIILSLLFSFVAFIVIDKELSPIDALKESVRITKGNLLKLLLLSLLILLINILGLLVLVVGLLVTTPISILAMVHAYRVLSRTSEPEPSLTA
jgi:uncharacterized membrane protein